MAADFWSWAQAEIQKISRQQGVSPRAASQMLQNNLNYAAKGAKAGKTAAKGTYAADRAKKAIGPVRDAIQKPAPKPSRPASQQNAAAKAMKSRASGYAASQAAKSAAKYSAPKPKAKPSASATKYR